MEYERIMKLADAQSESLFLWGARQVGKSTLVKKLFPEAKIYDLLMSDEYGRLIRRPQLLREELEHLDENTLVIIDEIQKIPQLLDEVHWLMVNRGIRFILCGSSARKLKRIGTNLLGGRALPQTLFPLVSAEIPDFDLIRGINNGMIPRHYTIDNPKKRLQAYIGVYLKEEIQEEAHVRQLASFNRFMDIAAQSDGEIVNYSDIAQDCGVSASTVKEYFNILNETLIGYMIPAFTLSKKRRAILAPKFYYFDVGIVNHLLNRTNLMPGSADFGHAFEHFMIQEIIAYLGYSESDEKLSYWRTAGGYEVDAIIGNGRIAIEFKSSEEIQSKHTKGLKAFCEDFPDARAIIVSLDRNRRTLNGIDIFPAMEFLKMLWEGTII
ncbi:MAG: AAA family ATPase [Bacteroidales bacterium]|nr:AAA family ATPase [Bacteroidales bacterium]MDD4670704.1 AAA family ATPase [Bacteroidales bacterium]